MARDTIQNTITELYGLLFSGGAPTVTGVTSVYDHEPLQWKGPVALTISFAGMDAYWWTIALKMYVQADHNVEAAQETMHATIPLVTAKFNDGFGPDSCTVEFVREEETGRAYFIVTWPLQVGRANT